MGKALAVAGIFVGLVGSRSAPAQTILLRQDPSPLACPFDTAAASDTAAFTLYITPPIDAARGADVRDRYDPFVRAVANNFEPPSRVSMATWPGTFFAGEEDRSDGSGLSCGIGPLTGTVRLTFENHHVESVKWDLLPDSPEVTQAVRAAIHQADSLGYFLGLKPPPGSPKGVVRLGITMDAGDAPDHGIGVLRVRMPYVRIQTPVSVQHIPTPLYPAAAQGHRIEDAVALQYVVDEDGRVRRGTIRVLDATYQDFADAAADAIAGAQFNPARVGACPVKAVVRQWIRFSIR